MHSSKKVIIAGFALMNFSGFLMGASGQLFYTFFGGAVMIIIGLLFCPKQEKE